MQQLCLQAFFIVYFGKKHPVLQMTVVLPVELYIGILRLNMHAQEMSAHHVIRFLLPAYWHLLD